MKNNVNEAMISAVSLRLDEVTGKIKDSNCITEQKTTSQEKAPTDETEEFLRLAMVKYFPKFEHRVYSRADIDKYYELLGKLYAAALSDDLRYFDAMNNAYEIMVNISDLPVETAAIFLNMYKDILAFHLKRLKNESTRAN